MFTPPRAAALRRMSLEELIGKLSQIEEHASLALTEHPRGAVLPRMRLVLAIAKQVRLHLEDQRDGGKRVAMAASAPPEGLRP
jgi:hypothetical protein